MRRPLLIVLMILALGALALLAGCPKPPPTELQGAPPVVQSPPSAPATSAVPVAKPEAAKEEMTSCPVLGTTMAKKDMIAYPYKGKTYYLCCPDCLPKFKANPEKYIKHPAKPLPPGAPMPMG